MTNRRVSLAGGRHLGLTGFGDPQSQRLVVLCHPSPGSSAFDPDPDVTGHRGVHIVSLERPGYGASDPWPAGVTPSFARYADDLAEYLAGVQRSARAVEGVDFGSVGVVGWGAGGLAALALAARHPHLVDRAVIIDTPSPPHFPDHAPAGPPYDVASLGLARTDPVASPGVIRRLERMLHEAGRQQDAGVRADQQAYRERDWSADLSSVRAETLLVYGDSHPVVSADVDGRWYRKRVPGARIARVQDGAGLSIATHWASIVSHGAPSRARATATRR